MAFRLLRVLKFVCKALLLASAVYALSYVIGEESERTSHQLEGGYDLDLRTSQSLDSPGKDLIRQFGQDDGGKPEVGNSASSDQSEPFLSEADVNKALKDFCRRMNLSLENPEDGPGEFAVPVSMKKEDLSPEDRERWEAGYKYAGYNVFLSDKIALRRRIPKFRDELCQNLTYPSDLPQASVIIPFHKEALSMLMRTVLSTLDRAPVHLLKEVILIDDFSQSDQLLAPLDEFASYLPKVRVLRNSQREGLMRTRMRGIMAATAPVVVIKDAHTEYFPGWLEPLLAEVAANRTTIARSHMFYMSMDHYQMYKNVPTTVHTFDFQLNQRLYDLPSEITSKRKSPVEPIPTPVMGGTEFAIDKQFFLEFGGYDPGMEIWGAEEMELSFKTWMCGGSMVVVPCSCVAHLFRAGIHRTQSTHLRNVFRVAEVWLDEYKHHVYKRYGKEAAGVDIGDITDRLKLREGLQCNSFRWYMENIAYMVDPPKDVAAQGELHNMGKPGTCLVAPLSGPDAEQSKVVSRACYGGGYEEFWMMTSSGLIRTDFKCLLYTPGTNQLTLADCSDTDENQRWNLTESKAIVHLTTGKCLSLTDQPVMEECTQGQQLQQWEIVRRPQGPSVMR